MNRPTQLAVALALLSPLAPAQTAPQPATTQPATTQPVNAQRDLQAAVAGGEYLMRTLKPDGNFTYLYDPRTDKEVPGYNLIRHGGAVYAMLELYEVTRDPKLLAAAEAPMKVLLDHVTDARVPNLEATVFVDDEQEVKLGGSALTLLVLAKHAKVTGSRDHLPTMRKLARWMAWSQAPDGRFKIQKMTWPEGVVVNWVSPYFPGEAALSLMRLYEIDPDPLWLHTAEQGARWIITVRDANVPLEELPHDHWLLYTLKELQRAKPDNLWLDQAAKITRSIIELQLADKSPRVEWVGGWYEPPRSTPTATRVEGLMAAHEMFRDAGRIDQAKACLLSARRGIKFFLTMQHQPTNAKFANPRRAAGGIGGALDDPIVRIDYVQHAMSALLAAHRAELHAVAP